MRLDYRIELSDIDVPRFSVEAQEGIGKLFTLATLVFNVLEIRPTVQIVFHGLSVEDPTRKIAAFESIMRSAGSEQPLHFEPGRSGSVAGSSSSYQWLTVRAG